jgi:hypothetical protein
MKKVLFVSISLFIAILVLSSHTNAQSSTFGSEKFVKTASDMADADKLALESIKMTSDRMFRDFTKRFKDASGIIVSNDASWHYISCYTDGDLNRIMYNKKGRWNHTIRTFDNAKLPESVRAQIEYIYPRYSIFGSAVEVNVSNRKAFLVLIEDQKSWKRIKVVDDETEVYEEYQKSK